jgi:hypothetical protein
VTDDLEATQPAPEPGTVTERAPAPVAAPEASTTPEAAPGPASPSPAAVADEAPPAPVSPPPPAPASPPAPGRRSVLGAVRSISVGVLFVLASLALLLSTTTWWLHDTVLSTDRFVALTAPMAEDPAVQEALTDATTEQLDQLLDLGPLGRYVVSGIAGEVYASDQFATIWERLMRGFHAQVVAVLRNEQSIATIEDGRLVLNLFPVMAAISERVNALGLSIGDRTFTLPTFTDAEDADASRAELAAALGRPLPPTFGVVDVGEAERLAAAQQYVILFDALVVILFVITAVLAILTLVLARRRIRMMALLAVGGLATLLAARLIVASAADAIATEIAAGGPAAIIGGEAITLVADSYRAFAGGILLVGLLVAIGGTAATWLLERRAAQEGGAGATGSLADGWFLVLAGLCVALVALLALGLTTATLAVVGAVYVAWLVVVLLARRRDRAAATA